MELTKQVSIRFHALSLSGWTSSKILPQRYWENPPVKRSGPAEACSCRLNRLLIVLGFAPLGERLLSPTYG
jgi:hypothetical protein